jgi:hypothetical protein
MLVTAGLHQILPISDYGATFFRHKRMLEFGLTGLH